MTAIRQIERLGLDPREVRHIVLSHLDFDHAGGLDDFPNATVHLLADEVAAAELRETTIDRWRYRPQQWSSRPRWKQYRPDAGETWFGFAHVRELAEVESDVLLVPLTGHTFGHAGVAIRRAGHWLFYVADAYFFHAEMNVERPYCTPGLIAYQTMMEKDRHARLHNQDRLRELKRAHSTEVSIFCAHDVREFERLSGRSHREPVPLRADVGLIDAARAWS
jgi:glyoxylase-like metal-dependent hydrolase (beta-lactamase superfamily II)